MPKVLTRNQRIKELEAEVEVRELQSLQHFESLLQLARKCLLFDATETHTIPSLIAVIATRIS